MAKKGVKKSSLAITIVILLFLSTVASMNTATSATPVNFSITDPDNGDIVSGTLTIRGTATPADEVDDVVVRIDGGSWNYADYNGYSWEWDWDTTTVPDGLHLIEAGPVTGSGNPGIHYRNVYVSNGGSGPNAPDTPSGPTSGYIQTAYGYTTSATDPDNDDICYGWDWDDDFEVDEWTSYYSSGTSVTTYHAWVSSGDYRVRVKAKDIHGGMSNWCSPTLLVHINGNSNHKPEKPIRPNNIDNYPENYGDTGESYIFESYTTDEDYDQVKYCWDWDDGTPYEWTDLQDQGTLVYRSHTWSSAGTYYIRVKAQDEHGEESFWSDARTFYVSGSSNNNPPSDPTQPSGPTSGDAGVTYTYNAYTIAQGCNENACNNVKLGFDFTGDGSVDKWTGYLYPASAGVTGSVDYSWNSGGTYSVRAIAQNLDGAISDWSPSLSVAITGGSGDEKRVYANHGGGLITLGLDKTTAFILELSEPPQSGSIFVSVESSDTSYVTIDDIYSRKTGTWGHTSPVEFTSDDETYHIQIRGNKKTDDLPDDRIAIYCSADDPEYLDAVVYVRVIASGGGGGGGSQHPTADAGGPYYTADATQSIEFDGSNSKTYDRYDGSHLRYRWDFDSNGIYDTSWSTDPIYDYIYPTGGSYDVTLQVEEVGGSIPGTQDTDTTTAVAGVEYNDPPQGNFSWKITSMGTSSWGGRPYKWWELEFEVTEAFDPDGGSITNKEYKGGPAGWNNDCVPGTGVPTWNTVNNNEWTIRYNRFSDCITEGSTVYVQSMLRLTDDEGTKSTISKNLKVWPIDPPDINYIPILNVHKYVKNPDNSYWSKHISANNGETVRFKISIEHTGVIDNAVNPKIEDLLSDNLRDIQNGEIKITRENGNTVNVDFKESVFEYKYVRPPGPPYSFAYDQIGIYMEPYLYNRYLDFGPVADEIKAKFASKGYPLTNAVMMRPNEHSPYLSDSPHFWLIIDYNNENPPEYNGYLINAYDMNQWIYVYKLDYVYPDAFHFPDWNSGTGQYHEYDDEPDYTLNPGDKMEIEFDVVADCFIDNELIDELMIDGQVIPLDNIPFSVPDNTNAGNKVNVHAITDGFYIVGPFWPPGQYDPEWEDEFDWVSATSMDYATLFVTPDVEVEKLVWDPSTQDYTEFRDVFCCDIIKFKCTLNAPEGSFFEKGLELVDHLPYALSYIETKSVEINLDPEYNSEGPMTPDFNVELTNDNIIWTINSGYVFDIPTGEKGGETVEYELFDEVTIIFEARVISKTQSSGPFVSSRISNKFGVDDFIFHYGQIRQSQGTGGSTEFSAEMLKTYEWMGEEILDSASFQVEGDCNCGDPGENQPPETKEDFAETECDTPVTIDVLENDSDPDENMDPSSLEVVVPAEHGITEVVEGRVIYTPELCYEGKDIFYYVVYDTEGLHSEETKVTVTIGSAGDDPDPDELAVEIDKPLEKALYRRNEFRRGFPITLIIRAVDINVSIVDPTGTVTDGDVKFFVDDTEVKSIAFDPLIVDYGFKLEEKIFGFKTIKVALYSGDTEIASKEMNVILLIF